MKQLQRILPGACVLLFWLYIMPSLTIHAASVAGVNIGEGMRGFIVVISTLISFIAAFIITRDEI